MLHDIGRVSSQGELLHGLFGGSIAEEYLESLVTDHDVIDRIERIIVRHTPTSMIKPQSTEEKIVFDADTIERLGFMGMVRGLMSKKGTMEEIIEDRITKRLADYDKLFYNESKALAKSRYTETLSVVKSLKKKLSERLRDIKEIGFNEL